MSACFDLFEVCVDVSVDPFENTKIKMLTDQGRKSNTVETCHHGLGNQLLVECAWATFHN